MAIQMFGRRTQLHLVPLAAILTGALSSRAQLRNTGNLPREAGSAKTILTIDGSRFTINGKPTFLLGFSYYGALGAPEKTLHADLDEMQQLGCNWIRVWATWAA